MEVFFHAWMLEGVYISVLIHQKLLYYPLLLHKISLFFPGRLSRTSLDSDWENIDMIYDTA